MWAKVCISETAAFFIEYERGFYTNRRCLVIEKTTAHSQRRGTRNNWFCFTLRLSKAHLYDWCLYPASNRTTSSPWRLNAIWWFAKDFHGFFAVWCSNVQWISRHDCRTLQRILFKKCLRRVLPEDTSINCFLMMHSVKNDLCMCCGQPWKMSAWWVLFSEVNFFQKI